MTFGPAVVYDNSGEEIYTQKFREKQEEIAVEAQTARAGFSDRVAELVQMQQQEILRLQKVIRDNTVLPDRYAVSMAIGSTTDKLGHIKHVLLATANDKSMWLMENYQPVLERSQYAPKWGRVPLLPQAVDEAKVG
jgi:hypothetical protein